MGVINQVLILDYQLKKEFMIDRQKWKINRIKRQIRKYQQQINIRIIRSNYRYKLGSLETALERFRDRLALAELELQELYIQFEEEERKVTIGKQDIEPMYL